MKNIAQNRKAYHDYEILDKVEAGIALTGAEVKSIRAGKVNISESFALCIRGEIFLNGLNISPYERGGLFSPDPNRRRKLLLRKRQIIELCNEVERKHLALVPLSMYFKDQWVKIELGLCKGLKKFDKREKIAEADSKRRLSQLLGKRR